VPNTPVGMLKVIAMAGAASTIGMMNNDGVTNELILCATPRDTEVMAMMLPLHNG